MNTYGTIELDSGYSFRYMNDGREVYGWVERNHDIVPGTSGFYRTNDPERAAKYAALNLDTRN